MSDINLPFVMIVVEIHSAWACGFWPCPPIFIGPLLQWAIIAFFIASHAAAFVFGRKRGAKS